jgi:hypothetical protein
MSKVIFQTHFTVTDIELICYGSPTQKKEKKTESEAD